jgi:hypothetical protein
MNENKTLFVMTNSEGLGTASFPKYKGLRVIHTHYSIDVHLDNAALFIDAKNGLCRYNSDISPRALGYDENSEKWEDRGSDELRKMAREARASEMEIVDYKE